MLQQNKFSYIPVHYLLQWSAYSKRISLEWKWITDQFLSQLSALFAVSEIVYHLEYKLTEALIEERRAFWSVTQTHQAQWTLKRNVLRQDVVSYFLSKREKLWRTMYVLTVSIKSLTIISHIESKRLKHDSIFIVHKYYRHQSFIKLVCTSGTQE